MSETKREISDDERMALDAAKRLHGANERAINGTEPDHDFNVSLKCNPGWLTMGEEAVSMSRESFERGRQAGRSERDAWVERLKDTVTKQNVLISDLGNFVANEYGTAFLHTGESPTVTVVNWVRELRAKLSESQSEATELAASCDCWRGVASEKSTEASDLRAKLAERHETIARLHSALESWTHAVEEVNGRCSVSVDDIDNQLCRAVVCLIEELKADKQRLTRELEEARKEQRPTVVPASGEAAPVTTELEREVKALRLDILPSSVDPESCSVAEAVISVAAIDQAAAVKAATEPLHKRIAELEEQVEGATLSWDLCKQRAQKAEAERDANAQAARELAELRKLCERAAMGVRGLSFAHLRGSDLKPWNELASELESAARRAWTS